MPAKTDVDSYAVVASTLQYIETVDTHADWEDRARTFLKVVEIVQELYGVLGRIPGILGINVNEIIRSSITIPLESGSMAGLVARDSLTGRFFSDMYTQFHWGTDPAEAKGIAGICATLKRHSFISDIRDPHASDINYWIPSPSSNERGVLALPILFNPPTTPDSQQVCIAVLTVTSQTPGVLKEEHCAALSNNITDRVRSLLKNSAIPPMYQYQGRRALDPRSHNLYTTPMQRERLGNRGGDSDETRSVLTQAISDLQEPRRGKKPSKATELLEVFRSANNEGVSMENLFPFFEESPDKARKVAAFIGHLNARYLKPMGFQIVGSLIYRISKYRRQEEE